MNTLIKLFLDKLSERIFGLIGSSIGTAASTYHAIQQAEQQSALEDLARTYEAEGKPQLAAQLREQAAGLGQGDPAVTGKHILHQVTQQPVPAGLRLGSADVPAAAARLPERPRRKRRSRPATTEDNGSVE